jgi:hypothetical protein
MFLGSRARPVRKADNLTGICEPIVYNMSQPYRPPRPVAGISVCVCVGGGGGCVMLWGTKGAA